MGLRPEGIGILRGQLLKGIADQRLKVLAAIDVSITECVCNTLTKFHRIF